MNNASHMWDCYLEGKNEDWCKIVRESSVDDVINFLELEPDNILILEKTGEQVTLKDRLWYELAIIVYAYGGPTDTFLGSTKTELKRYAVKVEKTLSDASGILEIIGTESLSFRPIKTKEIILAKAIYERLDALDSFEEEMLQTVQHLQKVSRSINQVIQDMTVSTKKRGEIKPSESVNDKLIFELCSLYKRYTGEMPVSWNSGANAQGDTQFSGVILPFLQAVLSNTFYTGEITEMALQKKISRMKKQKKYECLWQDSKK